MEDDSISGVEFESLHKLLSTAEEFPVEIAGVGELNTRWVGTKVFSQFENCNQECW